MLAFFLAQNYQGCAVIHGEHDAVVRLPTPGRKKTAKPPRWGGFDVTAEMVLPPPWSQFVSSAARSATMWNSRTGKRGQGEDAGRAARGCPRGVWRDLRALARGRRLRAARDVRLRTHDVDGPAGGELVLLRIDHHSFSEYDFVEMVSVYWFITEEALAGQQFDKVEAFCGSTI